MSIWKGWTQLFKESFRRGVADAAVTRHDDDDTSFYEDMRYLEDLAELVLDDTRLARVEISDDIYTDFVARPLHEMACRPIEATKFWETFDWPEDHAAHLLALWRMDREMNAWIDGIEAA